MCILFTQVVCAVCMMLYDSDVTRDARIDRNEAPLTIYIFTAHDPSGFISEDEEQRKDSVKDVVEALRRYRGVVVVADPEKAMLSLEVLAREKSDSGKRVGTAVPNGAGGYSTNSVPIDTAVLRVRLKTGGHSEEIVGTGRRYWSRAASDVADRLAKWVARNKELLKSKVAPASAVREPTTPTG